MTDITRTKTLILGGGISGIAFAHFTKDNDYLIVEKEMTLGGLCRSFHVGKSIFDFSGHFIHFKNHQMETYIRNLVEKHKTAEFRQFERKAGIFLKEGEQNKVIDYPFQANIHQLDKDTFIKCLSDLYETTAVAHQAPKTFDDLARNTFGNGITDIFFKPYNEKLYRTPLAELDANAMSRFIPKVNFGEVMSNIAKQRDFGYNSTFLYSPKSGIQGLVDAFVKDKELNFALGETVLSIDVESKTVQTDKRTIVYETLINTLPLPLFARLSSLASIPLKSVDVAVYNITYTKKVAKTGERAWIYFPGDSMFYRVGFYDFMTGVDKTSIYVEVSHVTGANEKVHSMDEILAELIRVGVIEEDAVVEDSQSLYMSPAYAILEPSTAKDVAELQTYLNDNDIYITGRYGKWQYQSIEDNIVDAMNLATNLQ